jgi:hypothetical protein
MAFSPYTGDTFTTKAAYNAKWDYQNLQNGGSHIVLATQSPGYPQNYDPLGEVDHLPPPSPYTGNTFITKAAYNAKWDYQNPQNGGFHIVPAIQPPK